MSKNFFGFNFLVIILLLYVQLDAVVVGSNTVVSNQSPVIFSSLDTDNQILGFANFFNGFSLENNLASLLFNGFFPIGGGPITLNGGTMNLIMDMTLSSGAYFTNVGTINGNNYSLIFSSTGKQVLPQSGTIVDGPSVFTLIAQTTLTNTPNAVAWSFDSAYAAAAVNQTTGNELVIYSFNGSTLTSLNGAAVANLGYTVRWNPVNYLIALGAGYTSGATSSLFVYSYVPGTNTLTLTSSISIAHNAKAVAWDPTGTYLAVLGDITSGTATAFIYIYSCTSAGVLTLVTSLQVSTTANAYQADCIAWSNSGNFLVLGILNPGALLNVYAFNGSTITLNASYSPGQTVLDVAWHPSGLYVAMGLGGGAQTLGLLQFTSGTLTYLTSANQNQTLIVYGVDWSTDGTTLLDGQASGATPNLNLYAFNESSLTLAAITQLSSPADIYTVRYSPNELYILTGDSNSGFKVYGYVEGPTVPGNQFVFNNLNILFNGDITIAKSCLFKGKCEIDGTGHDILLSSQGSISVGSQSSLTCKNCTLKGLSDSKIACADSTSNVFFQNSTLLLSNNLTLTQGTYDIVDDSLITGTNIFTYRSTSTMMINSGVTLAFDYGMTCSYDPLGTAGVFLTFADPTSVLKLSETSLVATQTAWHLTGGTILVNGPCNVTSGATVAAQGITWGGVAPNNTNLKLLPESGLMLLAGYLVNNGF